MAGRLEFKEKLGDILKEAIAQGGEMQKEEVEKFFAEDGLSEEQIDLVCVIICCLRKYRFMVIRRSRA